jgi:hypothetical protein
MENVIVKTTRSREDRTSKSRKTKKIISEEDIRRRAFEIYQENGEIPENELDDWLQAERELRGSDR